MDTGRPPLRSLDNARGRALSSDCRVISRLLPAEQLLFAGDSTCLGTFACRPEDPLFRADAPSTAHCVVFSRTPVWIRHERGARYVADPTVATFHNRGRAYQRWQIVDEGDRCDWVAYADDLLADAVSRFDRTAAGRDPMWFPAEFVPVSSHVYARQRRLFDRLHAGVGDGSEVEEEAVLLLDEVLSAVEPGRVRLLRRPQAFDAVQHVRAVIASAPTAAFTLRALARHAGMSPFQLCRTFSRVFGETMTSYRLRLRLLSALEQLRAGEPLVDVALAHGFSSHSHFSAAFRAAFGTTPRAWRRGFSTERP
jgi:AraC family transcriptional regulator